GMPLLAQLLHGVLHPWSVLTAWAGVGETMDVLLVLHVATATVGAGALARTLGAGRTGAAAAGLVYGLSGYLLGITAVAQYLAAGATAPWAVAALRHTGAGRSAARFAAAALALAALHLAGDPQWTVV